MDGGEGEDEDGAPETCRTEEGRVEVKVEVEVEVGGNGGEDLFEAISIRSLKVFPVNDGASRTTSVAGISVLFHIDRRSLVSFLPALPGGENVKACLPLEIGTARKYALTPSASDIVYKW